jgi:glycosyltransferase involved in cell wall biosynthesis
MDQGGFADAIHARAAHRQYAFVWMIKTWLYPGIRKALPGVPIFLEQQAAERDVWENLARNDSRWHVRLYSRWNGAKVLAFERRIYLDLVGVVSISAADAAVTRETYPPVPLIAVPMGVDCEYYRPSRFDSDPRVLLFSGGDATRNVQAIRRFVMGIAPRLRTSDPGYRLLWIGRVDPARHDFLPHEAVEITGYVEHVHEHFDRGAIFVAPFDMGEGVKVKIVEALAMGKLIVSTRMGVRGLELEGLPFVRIVDDDEAFARAILDFTGDPRRTELAREARQHAVEHFECEKVLRCLPAFIAEALDGWPLRRKSNASRCILPTGSSTNFG